MQGSSKSTAERPCVKALAERINAHLLSGGVVQVATYTRATLYDRRHAGQFFIGQAGDLRLRCHNGTSLCLSLNNGELLCSIRLGRMKGGAR